MSKQYILEKIKELALADGSPPGINRFQNVTGMKKHDWYGRYWSKWSDALTEAGFDANVMTQAHSKDSLLQHYLNLALELKRLPVEGDLRLKARSDSHFPSHSAFTNTLGRKKELLAALLEFAKQHKAPTDIIDLISASLKNAPATPAEKKSNTGIGYIYLIKFGDFFKIGRSNDFDRRLSEIKTKLPEEGELIHVIETDDPEGIEAYWHNRFKDRRARGEWFKPSNDDVKVLRKRKFM